MKKMMMTVAFGAAMVFLGASTVSAQISCPAHSNLGFEINECNAAGLVECTQHCVCDRGYHLRDASQPVSASNPCVRNVRGDRDGDGTLDIAGSVCIGDARERTVPGGFVVCQCPDALDTVSHDADQDGLQETRRVRVDWDRSERRAMGVALTGVIYDCMSASTGLTTQAEIDASATERRLALLEQQIRTICGTTDEATPEDVLEDCARFHEEALRGGVTSITVGDQTYTLGEFAERVMGRLAEIDATNERQDDEIAGLDHRVTALEARPNPGPRLADGSNSFTLSVGALGRFGGHTAGPLTGAGGISLGLYYRPADAPLDVYVRGELGWQATGFNVGDTPYVGGAAGASIYLGATRRDTMLQIGLWGENLWDPATDPVTELQADSLGWSFGGEVAVSIPLHPYFRLRPGIAIGFSERRFLDNGSMVVLSGAEIQGFLGIEGLLPAF